MESNCIFCGNPGVYRQCLDDVVCELCLYFILEFELSEDQKEEIFEFFNSLDYRVANCHPISFLEE